MKNAHSKLLLLLAVFFLFNGQSLPAEQPHDGANGKLKVFILAGQSNMEGKGSPVPLSWQLGQEKFRTRYTHFIENGDYDEFLNKVNETTDADNPKSQPTYLWSKRKDVWINYLEKRGELSVGFGSGQGFGPEYNFGHEMGNHFDEQVLIIKTAWGGRALARGFLPPSSRLTDQEYAKQNQKLNAANRKWNIEQEQKVNEFNANIEQENKTAEKKNKSRKFKPRKLLTDEEYIAMFGKDYRNMVTEVNECLGNLKERFPGYDGQGYEIKGFVWFQGWNDQYDDRWLSYETNMANFIRDVRKEFNAPKMPFVIGQMGNEGIFSKEQDKHGNPTPRHIIKQAQAKVPTLAEFQGNVSCVKTDVLWDMEAHAIYTGPGSWQKDINLWRQFGNDRAYHYYGSPWFFAQAGTEFGKSMLTIIND